MLTILAIENQKDEHIQKRCERYVQRMSGPFKLNIELLPSARVKIPQQQKEKESAAIAKAVKPGDTLILCDEGGKNYHTLAFAQLIEKELSVSRGRLIFAIGGAYGFTEELLQKHVKIRLSDFTLPHQLARLVLTEQLYRASEIIKGSDYHHL